jgi:glycosyltransferase involved in cell wall biosynthesis
MNKPFLPWAGGSEVYTLGHIKELLRRGIPARLIVSGSTATDIIAQFPDIPFLALEKDTELSQLEDTLVFIFYPTKIPTKQPSFLLLHVSISGPVHDYTKRFANNAIGAMQPIVTSRFMAEHWKRTLHLPEEIPVVYPAVEDIFSTVTRPPHSTAVMRVLFAGRPTPEKGVYTLLGSLHARPLSTVAFTLSCLATINLEGGTDIVHALFNAHPRIQVIPARHDRKSMAELYATYDIVVVPSSNYLWKEAFGMVSVEAQRAGCRVVASNSGGLPETDCGGLILVEPDNPYALAEGIAKAIKLGPLTTKGRYAASKKFTAADSVDSLLHILKPL